MRIIGITGGIGSGKTVVSKVLEALGYSVYNSDREAKNLVVQNDEVKSKIQNLLGDEAYLENGSYNTKYVAGCVFKDKELLTSLNNIIHPAVKNHFEEWCCKQTRYLLFKESALLLDHNFSNDLDAIVAVSASLETRIKRVQKRDPHRSLEDIEKIINNQGDWEEKSKKANYLISNDATFIVDQVKDMLRSLGEQS